jgi:2-haloacid dehalogenase
MPKRRALWRCIGAHNQGALWERSATIEGFSRSGFRRRSPFHLPPHPVTPRNPASLKVLAFDVFGTVVDWYGSIAREAMAAPVRLPSDTAQEFALSWRAGYRPAMQRVRSGELGWTRIDDLHRMILDGLLPRFGLERLSEAERVALNLAWHRLAPWPDSAPGLMALRKRFRVCTLSNGNMSLLADLARHGDLRWDLILSAEVFRHYKPDPQTYLGVADVWGVLPSEVMLVAAHKDDLRAAAACGLKTAYIERPMEFGADSVERGLKDLSRSPDIDFHATDFLDLARQLECSP